MKINTQSYIIAKHIITGEYVKGFTTISHGKYEQLITITTKEKDSAKRFSYHELYSFLRVDTERSILELLTTNNLSRVLSYTFERSPEVNPQTDRDMSRYTEGAIRGFVSRLLWGNDIIPKRSMWISDELDDSNELCNIKIKMVSPSMLLDPILFKFENPNRLIFENVEVDKIKQTIESI